jgi:hypothetical protein
MGSEFSRFDFESDFDIPAAIFSEVWPCPQTEEEAYEWLDHARTRLGESLILRNRWTDLYSSKRKNSEVRTDTTLQERSQHMTNAMESVSENEQLVLDCISEFEAAGFSLADYYTQSSLRLFSTQQVFDNHHCY